MTYISKAQFSIAGIHGNIYTDIVPDTLLNPPSSNIIYSESFDIDINQDGIMDIRIQCQTGHSPGHGGENTSLSALDSTTTFSFLRVDSTTYSPGCGGPGTMAVGTILNPFISGDTIKSGIYVSSGYLDNLNYAVGCYTYSDDLWIKNYDQYIGLKYNDGSTIQYGWIRVLVSGFAQVLVKDFSLGTSLAGINQLNSKTKKLDVYPNPASNTISLNITGIPNFSNSIITIQNILGDELKKLPFTKDINISELSKGYYFLQITFSSGESYKTKFIKQ